MSKNYKKQEVIADKEPNSPYSAGLVVGEWVFVSGHGPTNPVTGEMIGTTIEDQAAVTLRNVQLLLEKAGCAMDDCVKVTVHLLDMALFDRFNVVYRSFFARPYPARITAQAVLEPGQMIEIDAIAIKDSSR